MHIGNFKISLWGTVAILILCPLFVSLGFWQLDRAQQKLAMQQQFAANGNAQVLNLGGQGLEALSQWPQGDLNWRKAILHGQYDPTQQILLDNQHLDGQVGYFVYTLFRLANFASGSPDAIWVNRGWTPLLADRQMIPDMTLESTPQSIAGRLAPPPSIGMVLGDPNAPPEIVKADVRRVQVMDLEKLQVHFAPSHPRYVFNLQDAQATPFKPFQRVPGSGVDKHYGYAFQWFSFTLAILIIFAFQGIRRVSSTR